MSTPGTTLPGSMQSSSPSSTREAGKAVADTAKDEGRVVVDTAKQETARLASDARAELHRQGDEQTRRLAERMREIGGQLDGVQRGEAPSGALATVLSEAADRTNRLAARLDQDGIDAVASDVKAFARRRPGMFLLGAFGLGIVAGRTLRNADTHALVEAAKPSDPGPSQPSGPPLAAGGYQMPTEPAEPVGAYQR